MSWSHKLNETYDRVSVVQLTESSEKPIVPVGFAEKKADYLVVLNQDAECIDIHDYAQSIIVPTLTSAEGRTGGGAMPYPFFDDIRYMAGDLQDYFLDKYSDITSEYTEYFKAFVKQFSSWCMRESAPECLRVILAYLNKSRLMQDMKARNIQFSVKDTKKTVVIDVAGNAKRVWERPEVRDSWLEYLRESANEKKHLCYVTGNMLPILTNHAKLLGNAKLISAKDVANPMQYKGRFTTDEQALSVSMEASAKIHNALRWLLDRQGFSRFGMHIVLWSPGGAQVEDPFDQELGLKDDDGELPDTKQTYGTALAKAIAGYRQKLIYDKSIDLSQVVVMGLQAATPGRMSVTHYQEMSVSEYTESLEHWYSHCVWRLHRKVDERSRYYISTPAPREIAEAVFGEANMNAAKRDIRVDKAITKQVRRLYMQLLPCIIERKPLPLYVEQTAFRRVCNPLRFTTQNGKWDKPQWERALCVTCALIAKRAYDEKEEEHDVTLDTNRKERNYLYGRLLAVANQIEMLAMNEFSRQTNAIRYMQAFQLKPVETWRRINNLLIPYLGRLKNAGWYAGTLNDIGEKIDFTDNTPLDGRFLEGYYAQGYSYQVAAMEAKKKKGDNDDDTQ